MPYADPEKQAEWQRRYRQMNPLTDEQREAQRQRDAAWRERERIRKREWSRAQAERERARKAENEAWARAAWRAYQESGQ